MKIINFDKHKKNPIIIDDFAPIHPFRLIITGPSGCGKTNLLLNLLVNGLYFDKLYVFGNEIGQEKYETLKNYTEHIHRIKVKRYLKDIKYKKNHKTNYDKTHPFSFKKDDDEITDSDILEEIDRLQVGYFSNTINDDFIENLDREDQKIIVFDDVINERNQDMFIRAFTSGRHRNCSVIYLTQEYFSVPRGIKRNANYFIFFNCPDRRTLQEIAKSHATNIPFQEFLDFFNQACSKDYGFVTIDKLTKNKKLKLRDGLEN